MRRSLILLIALGLLAAEGFAQLSITSTLKAGINSATFKGDDIQGNEAISQYAVGMAIEFDLPGPFSIQPEILYSTKGSRIGVASPHPETIKLAYVDIPVLFKFNLAVPVLNPSVYAGPSVGVLLSAKGQMEGILAGTPELDLKDQFATTDYGIVAGAGVSIPIVVTDLSLEARYYYGLSKLGKTGSLKQYNRVISLLAGIAL